MNDRELLVLAAKATGKLNFVPYNEPFTYPTNTAEVGVMRAEIARLNHQHANDEAANQILSDACDRKQQQIDALMLEYCPDEMTPVQIAEWEKNQVSPATSIVNAINPAQTR